eukprot:CAMPEP_0113893632 /NCGR_PEP_ID=MMETSP0780_2-20120614/16213_1 /TAXON_ID=652834 /ORGANISM="Palpitomonas bilix" /LENGTH=217 /DNA_ID=CAMNT_0000883969 /DNA_START=200 /DNA_END=853 /DNA_ORIENTATION=+ /assembly_acc=CAM_ASM_000599
MFVGDEYKLDTSGLQRGFDFNPDRMVIRRNHLNYLEGFAAVRAFIPCPVDTDLYYFEMKIARLGASNEFCTCSIGVTSGPIFSLHNPVGWDEGTFGYHGDDGCAYEQIGRKGRGVQFGPITKEGDVVGCGLNFIEKTIFFTHNGRMLGHAFHMIPEAPIFPTFSVKNEGETIAVNLGCFPFLFDIHSYKIGLKSAPSTGTAGRTEEVKGQEKKRKKV